MVATRKTSETTVDELADLMVGSPGTAACRKGQFEPGEFVLSVRNLTVKDGRGRRHGRHVSFDVRAGEIVGIAGVAGNGQSELLEALAGIRKAGIRRNPLERQDDR